MNLYSIALFLHVVGALGFFAALGLEWFMLSALRRTTTVEQVRGWFQDAQRTRGLAGVSLLIILIAGFYMTFAAWGGVDWIEVAFVVVLLQGAVGGILTSPRLRALQKATVEGSGSLPANVYALVHHPALWVSMLTRVGMGVGIVYLMCVKPLLVGSIVAVVVATLLGLLVALATMGNRRAEVVTA